MMFVPKSGEENKESATERSSNEPKRKWRATQERAETDVSVPHAPVRGAFAQRSVQRLMFAQRCVLDIESDIKTLYIEVIWKRSVCTKQRGYEVVGICGRSPSEFKRLLCSS
ncbi:hypothetical protein Bca52824_021804 [Brassica carinata]|uniref:Uncharacterized protein n=1 Tax=Brassica carinata TaxID=52824 RepID=A0A8X7VF76_BRACI|nr:hypothetical protein Bca52824_021804 [Brassica carinata]